VSPTIEWCSRQCGRSHSSNRGGKCDSWSRKEKAAGRGISTLCASRKTSLRVQTSTDPRSELRRASNWITPLARSTCGMGMGINPRGAFVPTDAEMADKHADAAEDSSVSAASRHFGSGRCCLLLLSSCAVFREEGVPGPIFVDRIESNCRSHFGMFRRVMADSSVRTSAPLGW